MKILLDTNVIVGLSIKGSQPILAKAIKKMRARGDEMFIVPQVIYEFWVVATRPEEKNGLGLRTEAVASLVDKIQDTFKLLDDSTKVYYQWFSLVKEKSVSGKPAHDARLVAAMAVHGLDAILTQNGNDFKKYNGMQILNPKNL
ncbi:MAG: type II toxin-antitoxin system VapC family toxin [Planctomycetia bacterium]|nr:type II toxin-antitoxin system VapC family toxin [Planctomycetia bacterium]